jgi:flagellar M-ring protein FliF
VLVALIVVFGADPPGAQGRAPPPVPPLDAAVDVRSSSCRGRRRAAASGPGPDACAAGCRRSTSSKKLDAAPALAKENPAAVANIVRGWVSGEAA